VGKLLLRTAIGLAQQQQICVKRKTPYNIAVRLSTILCYLLPGTYHECTSPMSQPAELSSLWETRKARFNNIFPVRRASSASQFLLRTALNSGLGAVRSIRQECSPRMFRER